MAATSDKQDSIRARRIPRVGSFVLFAVLLVLAGLAITVWFPAHRQKRAVEGFVQNHGYVVYAPGFEVSQYNTARPEGPEWLWSIVDPNLVYNVTTVRFDSTWHPQLRGDVLMPIVGDFTAAETVSIYGVELTNKDLRHLQNLPRLRQLYLSQTKLAEGELNELRELELEWLCLSRTWVDDESLRSLSDMTKLEYLDLTRTRVTDAGLVHLEPLTSLKTLYLNRTLVTQSGADSIAAKLPACSVSWEPLERR
jgi:hypothetical protein